MAKKKNRSNRNAQKLQNSVKITAKDVKKGKDAIKTMVLGALILALFMGFFAFRIQNKTMFERVSDLFSSDTSDSATASR